jgi:mannose-6-phosphate isomerase-like protein (cupin superfamily)
MIQKVNLGDKFSLIHDHWQPRIAGRINDFAIKLVKIQGEFIWHHHDHEDELFLVVKGQLRINLRDQEAVVLNAGEFVIIPHGVEHQPVAEQECEIILLEPAETLNTGTVENERGQTTGDDISR